MDELVYQISLAKANIRAVEAIVNPTAIVDRDADAFFDMLLRGCESNSCIARTEEFRNQNKKGLHSAKTIDRLSDLSDDLLAHILSNQNALEAFRTSILSKRWVNVWTKIHVLDVGRITNLEDTFYCYFKSREELFIPYVDKVLSRIEPGAQTLSLDIYPDVDAKHLHKWIGTAMSKEFSEIQLNGNFITERTTALLMNGFNSKKLVVLKLRALDLKVLPSLSLPSLEILHLRKVSLWSMHLLENVASGCPMLKELFVDEFWGFLQVHDYSIELQSLKMEHIDDGNDLSLSCLINYDIAKQLPSLVCTRLHSSDFTCNNAKQAAILSKVSSARKLQLHRWSRYVPPTASSPQLPLFRNLMTLEMDAYSSWPFIKDVLEHSPILECVEIRDEYGCWRSVLRADDFDRLISIDDMNRPPSRCLSQCLQGVTLSDFTLSKEFLEVVAYFVQHIASKSNVLEVFMRNTDSTWEAEHYSDVCDRLIRLCAPLVDQSMIIDVFPPASPVRELPPPIVVNPMH